MNLKLVSTVLLPIALVLAGCASPSDLLKTPTLALETKLTPNQAKDCLIEKDPSLYQVVAFKGGWRITEMSHGIYGDQPPVLWAAEVMPSEQGSHIDLVRNYGPDHPWQACLDTLPRT